MSIDLAYAELGLTPGASESEVRAAWRRLVSRWHPDRNPSKDALDLMQRINQAYERIRLSAFSGGSRDDVSAAPSDGAARRAARPAGPPAPTLRRRLRLSLEEAALGCTKVLRVRLTHTCAACAGHGMQPGAPCPGCEGSGTVRVSAWFGWLASQSPCRACAGSGVVSRSCPACDGRGKRASTYQRSVRIPAGARSGDVLSAERTRERPGDFDATLELHVKVSAHKLFALGDDGTLRCEMPVDGFAWVANAWIDVPTLTGVQQMRLQRGRHVYRLRGQGVPLQRRGSPRGDYLVTVVPTFPALPSARQQVLLDQLASASAGTDGPGSADPVRAWRRTVDAWKASRTAGAAAP